MFTSLTTFVLVSGAALVASSLLTTNSNNTSSNGQKQIKDFAYAEIKTQMEYELYGESNDRLNEILRQNGFYNEKNLSSYEVATMLANKAQYGNQINPSYFAKSVQDRLNEKYN